MILKMKSFADILTMELNFNFWAEWTHQNFWCGKIEKNLFI
jgi:hypothetical protein